MKRNTVSDWLKKARKLPPLSETLVDPDEKDESATTMEIDDIWSFVDNKGEQSIDMDCSL